MNRLILLVLGISFLHFSCGQEQSERSEKTATPEALQDKESLLDVKSYSRSGGDLTEELYQELVSKNPALQKLETEIEKLGTTSYKKVGDFNSYDNKSKSYYGSANYKASVLSDSLLKKKITDLIAASSKKYEYKTAALSSLLQQVAANNSTLQDHHSVLKIVLTLPLIEKYQNDHLPVTKEYKNLLHEQQTIIGRTDSLTPKY